MDNKSLTISQIQALSVTGIPDDALDTVLSELTSLSTTTPLDYEPHAKQLLFHTSEAKIRFLSGGNRSGKTEAGTLEAIFHATGLYPRWYPLSGRISGPNRGRVVVSTYSKGGGEVVEPKLADWLPADLVVDKRTTVKGHLEKISIRHVSGGTSTIDFLTHEQDDDVFEGWSGHWAWFDEPPPREKFIATQRGLIDYAGRCWLTLTPISQPWLYDEYISTPSKDTFFLTVDIRDNTALEKKLGKVRFEEEIRIFESRLREDEKEARLHGRFKHLSGLVYKEFDPSIHIIPKDRIKIEPSWPKYFVLDPHDQKEHFGIWATVDPLGNIYVIDEIKQKDTIKEFSKKVLVRELMNKDAYISPMKVRRIGDPNKMQTPSAVNGLTFKKEFAKSGLHFRTNVNNDIHMGHLAVSGKLWYDKQKPISSTNKPKLYFFRETTPICVKYMQMYVWDEWRGSSKDTKGDKEKPQERYKDFPDCVRYLVMSNPTFYVEEADPQGYNDGSTTGYH